ncbi:unnamed protein product [Linum tenue]|uniref:Uncharacterized protein n=1 Tax=Linum tenue TaxID=586396 RepID=A0AAV0J369_9ROSI|nr:unnamed protein product [Linum tenue]
MGRGSSFAIDEEMLALVVPCSPPSLSSSESGSPQSKRCCNRQASSTRRHPLLAVFTVSSESGSRGEDRRKSKRR